MTQSNDRRGFLQRLLSAAGLAAAPAAAQAAPPQSPAPAGASSILPSYTRAQHHKSLKQSSYDKTGGNRDAWRIEPGAVYEIFRR